MMSVKSPSKIQTGFTLLEVLVAFSLLSILLTVIIQSQAETAYFLEKTGKQQLVQRVVMNELSVVERSCATAPPPSDQGTFGDDHLLVGDRWERIVVEEDIFLGLIQTLRVSYRISWKNPRGKGDHSFESSIFCGRS
jgi:prepilin-type N-terminal cleavage/methylation domain-containing protein